MSDKNNGKKPDSSGRDDTAQSEEDGGLFNALDEHTSYKRGLGARIRGYFLAGILVTAPIGITVYLTYVFVTFMDNRITGIIPDEYFPDKTIPGLGVVLAATFFILVGWFAKNFLGRLIISVSEYFVHRMPVIRTLYGAIKQIFETIMASQSQAFREVVMLEYPRRDVWSIGFVTGTTKGEVQRLTDVDTINVFVPTTPNPTSGYLLFVPKKDLHYLDMSVEEGVKLVVSAGIITPPDRAKVDPADLPAAAHSDGGVLPPAKPKRKKKGDKQTKDVES